MASLITLLYHIIQEKGIYILKFSLVKLKQVCYNEYRFVYGKDCYIMALERYGKIQDGRRRKQRRRITGIVIIAVIFFAAMWIIGALAGNSAEFQERSAILRENHALKEENAALQAQIAELQGQVAEKDKYIASIPAEEPTTEEPNAEEAPQEDGIYEETPEAAEDELTDPRAW